MKILLFSEFIASNRFLFFVIEKLHLVNPFIGMGTYIQGIPIQNTVDFIWGTESGIRTLPVSIFFALLSWLARSQWSTFYLLCTVLLPFFLFFVALRIYRKLDVFVIIAAVFYSWNTWIVDRLASGFWQLNIAYALLPFFVVIPIVLTKKEYVPNRELFFWSALYSILSSIVILGQPHFLVMISLFLILHMLQLLLSKNYFIFKRLIVFYLITGALFCLINFYFFIPSILFPEYSFTAPNQYFSLGSVIFNGTGATLVHVLQMSPIDFPFHDIPMNFIEWVKFLQLGIIPIFFILKKKKEWLLFICLICFVFLAKGLHEPFSHVSILLYTYMPFMHFFRDPERFLGAVSLFGSLIIAFTDRKVHLRRLTKISMYVCILLIFVIANWNIVTNKLFSILVETSIPNQYVLMQKYINTLHTNKRLLIIPNIDSYAGYTFFHDIPLPSSTLYDMALPLSIPLADSSNYPDTYSNQVSAQVYNEFTKTYNPYLLSVLGVKYVLTDTSITSPSSEKDISTESARRLPENSSIEGIKIIKNLHLLEYKNITSLLTEQQPIFAIGDLNTIMHIHEKGITRPVILLNQSINANLLSKTLLKNNQILIDIKNPILTLTAEQLAEKYSIDILGAVWDYDKSLANCEPYKMGYILPNGNLFTSGRCVVSTLNGGDVSIPINLYPGRYKIFVKAMNISNPSSFTLATLTSSITIPVNTDNKLVWLDGGEHTINSNQKTIILKTESGNPIAIDYLLFVPLKVWDEKVKVTTHILGLMKKISYADIKNEANNEVSFTDNLNQLSFPASKYVTYRFSWGRWWSSNTPSVRFISDGYGMTFIAKNTPITSIEYFPDIIYQLCILVSVAIVVGLLCYIAFFAYQIVSHDGE